MWEAANHGVQLVHFVSDGPPRNELSAEPLLLASDYGAKDCSDRVGHGLRLPASNEIVDFALHVGR